YVTEDLHTPHGDVRTTFFPTGTWGTSEQCAVDFRVGPIACPFQDVRADDGPVSVDVRLGKGLTMLAIGAVEPFAPNPGAYTWVAPFGCPLPLNTCGPAPTSVRGHRWLVIRPRESRRPCPVADRPPGGCIAPSAVCRDRTDGTGRYRR